MSPTIFLILFSVIFLSVSCRAPQVDPQLRCFNQYGFHYGSDAELSQFFSSICDYKNDPEKQKEFLRDVLKIFGKSRCNLYDLNTVSPVDPNGGFDRPLIENDLYGGFSFESWAKEITPWGKELRQYGEDECRQ